jgi:hypothetical protein
VRYAVFAVVALALPGCGAQPSASKDANAQQRAGRATRLLLRGRGVENVSCSRAAAATWLCIAHGHGRYSCKVTVTARGADPSCITGTNMRTK